MYFVSRILYFVSIRRIFVTIRYTRYKIRNTMCEKPVFFGDMNSLRDYIIDAAARKRALGHFNISTVDALWGVFRAARELRAPVIIGVSEGERSFIGVRQVAALVRSIREEYDYPIFLNADHSYSLEKVEEAAHAGFDAVIFDGAKLSFDENVVTTKRCVELVRRVNPDIIVEGEIGFIGESSKLLDAIPAGAEVNAEHLTKPEELARFVRETGVDLVAPAVGNLHGMLRGGGNPRLDIERIALLREAAGIPLVLHGGSGIADEDVIAAVHAGIAIVHFNTELRLAYRQALALSLAENPDEIAPYKFLRPAAQALERVVSEKLRLFWA
ncbi:MAG: class II fructose-bisphosphate aldolase [bacterium]|nr:class II fructose-bisphosphate aldolase [bacterium]